VPDKNRKKFPCERVGPDLSGVKAKPFGRFAALTPLSPSPVHPVRPSFSSLLEGAGISYHSRADPAAEIVGNHSIGVRMSPETEIRFLDDWDR